MLIVKEKDGFVRIPTLKSQHSLLESNPPPKTKFQQKLDRLEKYRNRIQSFYHAIMGLAGGTCLFSLLCFPIQSNDPKSFLAMYSPLSLGVSFYFQTLLIGASISILFLLIEKRISRPLGGIALLGNKTQHSFCSFPFFSYSLYSITFHR
jgi:hypothetical protein